MNYSNFPVNVTSQVISSEKLFTTVRTQMFQVILMHSFHMSVQYNNTLGFEVTIHTIKSSFLTVHCVQMTSQPHFHCESLVTNVTFIGVPTSDFGGYEICITAVTG